MPKIFNIDFSATTSVTSVSKPLVSDLNNISYNDLGKNLLVAGQFLGYDKYSGCIVRSFSGGSRDDSFVVNDGFVANDTSFTSTYVYDIQIDSLGNYYVGGSFTTYNGVSANRIIKLTTGGTIDYTFNYGTGFNSDVRTISIQTDGKILVGGFFTSYNGVSCNNIVRLNTDGTIDNAFSTGSGFNSIVNNIKLTSGGLIYVVGGFTSYNGFNYKYLIRLNTNGSIDTSFNTLSGFTSANVNRIIIDSSNNLYVGGSFTSYSSVTANNIIKLTSGGTIDTSFNTGTGFNSIVKDMSMDSNGDLYIVGGFTTFTGSTNSYMIKLKSDGSKDTTFNNTSRFLGSNFNGLESIFVDSNGKIFIGGSFTTYSLNFVSNLIKLNTDGSVDPSFNYFGTLFGIGNIAYVIKQDLFGNLIFGGRFNGYKEPHSLVSINTYDAKRSYVFNTNYGINVSASVGAGSTRSLLKSQNSNIYVGGFFENYNQLNSNYRSIALLGLNSGGTGNNLIDVNSGPNFILSQIYEDSVGGIYLTGQFTAYKSVAVPRMVKITSGATIDNTFDRSGLQSVPDYVLDFDSSNNIYLGGSFTTFSSQTNNRIIKLLPTGFKDTSFDNSIGFNNNVTWVKVDNYGKILVGGGFTQYKGISQNYIIRLNPDGSKDNTFNVGSGLNSSVISIQTFGDKIFVVGNFTSYNGVSVNKLIKLNYDGSIDTTFNIKNGFSNTSGIIGMLVNTKGEIYVYGQLLSYQVYGEANVVKIKFDGSRDVLYNVTNKNFKRINFPYLQKIIEL